ncbi:aspartic peptidase A1 [Trametes elegans]|nr:aspartic peptidase A1 [Trametes elegans]
MFSPSLLVTLLSTFVLSSTAFPLPPLTSPALGSTDFALDGLRTNTGVALPLAKRFNNTGSANIVKLDQARAKATRSRSQASYTPVEDAAQGASTDGVFNVDATSQAVAYIVTVSALFCTHELLVDTGSSNTWVGANKPFVPSSTTQPTGDIVSVTYGSGSFTGYEVLDTITLANGLTLPNQSIGVALQSEGFDGVHGILGLGPSVLTCGTLLTSPDKCDPTVTDTAWNAGLLDAHELGISFRSSESLNQQNGELTFGGIDRTKFKRPLQYVPLTSTSPASSFVGYDQSITYGDKGIVLDETAGILDTGTTLILIATDAFNKYQKMTGAVPDDDTGLLRITQEQYGNLQNLNFNIGGNAYALTPNAQIWPRALNEEIGGTSDAIYLIVADLGSDSGQGLDFINGMSFMERFYAVYDIGNSRVGFAQTQYTDAETN